MLQITTIASSSKGNLYILDNGNSRLMLECGLPWRKVQQALGFRFDDVAGCLVTHEHSDHSGGVKDAARAGIDIYCSRGTAEAIGVAGHRINLLKSEVVTKIGRWVVLPLAAVHDCREPLSFLISTGDEKLLFVTDSAYIRYKFHGLTRIMVECNFSESILESNIMLGIIDGARVKRLRESHFSFERVKEFLKANDLSKLKEIHLLHLSRDNSDKALFKAEIERLTGVPVYVCKE